MAITFRKGLSTEYLIRSREMAIPDYQRYIDKYGAMWGGVLDERIRSELARCRAKVEEMQSEIAILKKRREDELNAAAATGGAA